MADEVKTVVVVMLSLLSAVFEVLVSDSLPIDAPRELAVDPLPTVCSGETVADSLLLVFKVVVDLLPNTGFWEVVVNLVTCGAVVESLPPVSS